MNEKTPEFLASGVFRKGETNESKISINRLMQVYKQTIKPYQHGSDSLTELSF
jgi:hypothetical protein